MNAEEARAELEDTVWDSDASVKEKVEIMAAAKTYAQARALAVLNDYIAEVNRLAEADVLAGNPLEGAHHRAMGPAAERVRARIKGEGE
jgi:hypothetical protein